MAPVHPRCASDLVGWDLFGLAYKMPCPLDGVFDAETMPAPRARLLFPAPCHPISHRTFSFAVKI